MSIYKNKKTGNIYEVIRDTVINATNAHDGQRMVLYRDNTGKHYVREFDEFNEKFELSNSHSIFISNEPDSQKTKMIIVVRKDLKMPKGKIASQVAHAAMGAMHNKGELKTDDSFIISNLSNAEKRWLSNKFTKVVVWCDDLNHLEQIKIVALENDLNTCVITDAGDTVFGGVPTVTCIAIGPDWISNVNRVTNGLKLLV